MDSTKLVVVHWVDAVSDGGWEEDEKPDIHHVVTAGFIVSETKDAICIASTVSGTFTNARMHIPKAWIKNRKVIKLDSKNTKSKSVKDGRNRRGKSVHEVSSIQDMGQLQN